MIGRDLFRRGRQPGLDVVLIGERGPVRFTGLREPDTRPAPCHGQHSRHVWRELLGLSDDEIEVLVALGVVQDLLPENRHPIEPTSGD